MRQADGDLVATMTAALTGYADRPALAQRASQLVSTAGRSRLELLARYESLSYRELWQRMRALANCWLDAGFAADDFVATLGFTSLDYATVDLTCMLLGAVAVPLPITSSARQLAPIIDETRPRILATDISSIAIAVQVALEADCVERLVVFDYDERADDQREAFAGGCRPAARAGHRAAARVRARRGRTADGSVAPER